jgi:probable O-glycosylation ligase (exosortase A-associated)
MGPPNTFLADNNQLAMHLIIALPLIRYLQIHSGIYFVRHGLFVVFILAVFSIIGSQSRGAFLGLAATGIAMVWLERYRAQMGAVALSLLIASAFVVPNEWVERMQTITEYQQDESAVGRLNAWTFAYRVAQENPLGGGFNVVKDSDLYLNLVPEAEKARAFHSIYFEVLGEHGFVGLLIFLCLGLATFMTFHAAARQTKGQPDLEWAHDLGRLGRVSVIGYGVAGTFLNAAFFDISYQIVAIAVVLHVVVQRQMAGQMIDEPQLPRAVTARA